MQIEVLHLDGSLMQQRAFMDVCKGRDATFVPAQTEARHVRLWGRDADIKSIKRLIPRSGGPAIAFTGSGDFHHISALLLERAIEQEPAPVTLIHFDNHPDWVKSGGVLHCGSWINRALANSKVAKVITAGVCSADLQQPELKRANLAAMRGGRLEVFPFEQTPSRVFGQYEAGPGYRQEGHRIHWHCIANENRGAFAALLLLRIETAAIYITVDKDVLSPSEAATNWDQGRMTLDDVLFYIRELGGSHRIVGADVTGDWSVIEYRGGPWTTLKKRGESFIDQPKLKITPTEAAAVNEKANLALLAAFSDVTA